MDLTLNRKNLFQLRDLHKSLEKQYNQLKEKVNVMREKLEILWDFLEVSPSKKNKVQKYTDYTQVRVSFLLSIFMMSAFKSVLNFNLF